MAWKQRLYAFLLRRVLGPYLSSDSLKQLHSSIEVSLQEGRFSLSDVELNAAYLSSRQSKGTIHHVKIRKLQILLILVEKEEEESSSVTWRAMNLGRDGAGVWLKAQVEIDGVEIQLGPPTAGETPAASTPPPPKKKEETMSSTASRMLSSYIDAALASLRLSVDVRNVHVRVTGAEDKAIDLDLAYARYHDKDSHGVEMHKAIDFSGISVQTCIHDRKELVAKLDGGGQVSIQATNVGSESRLQQDISLSLYQRINLSLGESSLRIVLSIANDFSTLADSVPTYPNSALSASEYFDPPPEMLEEDEKYVETMKGIIEQQYVEARHLAERNEVRGGILVQDDDTMSFDAFFDANDLSFSTYKDTLTESILSRKEPEVEGNDFMHTRVRIYLGEFRVKVAFPSGKTNLPLEYMLVTLGEMSFSLALSGRSAEATLSILQVQAETSNLSSDGKPEIESLLLFQQDDNPSSIVAALPCIDVQWKKSGEDKSLDAQLQALTVFYSQHTVSKLSGLCLVLRESAERSSYEVVASPPPKVTNFSVLLSAITLLVPVNNVPVTTFDRLFDRCGYTIEDEPCRGTPLVCFAVEDCALSTLDSSFDKIGQGATGHKASCVRALLYVSARLERDSTMSRRMDVLALSGHVPLCVTHSKNAPYAKCESEGERILPKVPAISSFKAIEEEDEDMNDGGRGEIMHSLRSPDPQPSLLQAASLCHEALEVFIPDLTVDLSKNEIEALKEIIRGCLPEDPKSQNEDDENKENRRSIAMALRIDQVTMCVHAKNNDFSFKLIGCGWRAFAALKGSKVTCSRLMMHAVDFYSAKKLVYRDNGSMKPAGISLPDRCDAVRQRSVRNASTKATAILYRSQLFPPLSPESPAILLDLMNRSDQFCSEWNVHFSVYNMTHRYDIDSTWISHLLELVKSEEQAYTTTNENTFDEPQAQKAALTMLFVTFADCNIDYTSAEIFDRASRSILRVSDIRFSSNIISPRQPAQAFKLSIVDAALMVGNRRYPYNDENACLSRSVTILGPHQLDLANSKGASPNLHQMNLVTIATLDAFVASVSLSSKEKRFYMRDHGMRNPNVEAQLTLGTLCIYGCKDSFECFTDTIGELSLKLTGLTSDKVEALKLSENCIEDSDSSEDKYFDSNEGEIDELIESMASANLECDPESFGNVTVFGTIYQGDHELNAFAAKEAFELDGYDWTTIDHDWSKDDLPPGEEQVARWFDDDKTKISTIGSKPRGTLHKKLQLISHYIHVKPTLDPLAEGDMNAARHAGTSLPPSVNVRTMIRDLSIKCRFYDGYDWPQDVKAQNQPANRKYNFIIDHTLDKKVGVTDERPEEAAHISQGSDRKKQLLGALLDSEATSADLISTFHNLPLPEERGKILMDKAEQRRLSRKVNSFLQVSLSGFKLRMDSFEESSSHRLASCLDLRMEDLFIAETISSSKPTKLLGEWLNDIEHPRDTKHGLVMLRMCTWKPGEPITEDNKVANDESEAVLEFLPLRCYVDQRAVMFLRAFFTSEDEAKERAWASNVTEIPPPLFKSFRVKPCKLKVNYTPARIDIDALRDGSIVELVNLSPLNDMVIMLKAVQMEGKIGFGAAFSDLAMSWIRNICATQLHKFITNSSPFQPFTSISTGAVDMIVLPWSAVQNGDGVSKALGKGVKSFAGSVVYETLNVTTKLTSFAANQISRLTCTSPQRSTQSSLPSRPSTQPRNVFDTTNHALQSLAQGLETANYKIVIIPYREYHRTGPTGAVRSVVRGIPVAVVAPLGGASEALSYTLLGARNQVRPDIRREEEASRRGLSFED